MQDQKVNSPAVAAEAATTAASRAAQNDFIQKIVDKIKTSENILIALSRDPSVDEIAAAIGLTLFLDGMQKHATAIYSGRTPDELAFLQPGETFEKTTDSLQDFIIALNKEKADHLRYKLEGDFVKVFITPYKTRLTEEDLSFSHGDYNVDFVIAINVAAAANLDEALHEHGRIMHDASVVNITTGEPGKFGEIEWSSPTASSLCEMITGLIFVLQGSDEKPLDRDVATALLTGIVAATDRFSNNRTNPDTLGIASKLMAMGADQQLITSNINGNERVKNMGGGAEKATETKPADKTSLTVEHDDEVVNPAAQMAPNAGGMGSPAPSAVGATNNVTPESVIVQPVIPTGAPLSTDTMVLPGVNVSAPNANEVTTPKPDEMRLPNVAVPGANPAAGASTPVSAPSVQATPKAPEMAIPGVPTVTTNASTNTEMQLPGVPSSTNTRSMVTAAPTEPTTPQVGPTLQPPEVERKPKNYAEMMEEALAEPMPGAGAAPEAAGSPAGASTMEILTAQPGQTMQAGQAPQQMSMPQGAPAMAVPPMPTAEPVANPMGGAVLPPPPAPDVSSGMMPPVLPPVQVSPEITG